MDSSEMLLKQTLSNVQKLTFKSLQEKVLIFPDTVTDLTLDINCSLELIIFPKFLKKLSLVGYFDEDIRNANLPDTLESLTLGNKFDQDIRNANFPKMLKSLTLGNLFNQDVKNANLPNSLRELTFGWSFNKDISDANFPDSLTHLTVVGISNEYVNLPKSASHFVQVVLD